MATLGVAAGAAGGLILYRLIGSYLEQTQFPGALPTIASAIVLLLAAATAALLPAARAARVDVMQALRDE